MRYDGTKGVAHFKMHMARLENHASRVGISWPENSMVLAKKSLQEWCAKNQVLHENCHITLVRLRLTSTGDFQCNGRKKEMVTNQPNSVLTLAGNAVAAPRWEGELTGCKHGEWQPYHDAHRSATDNGCDIALLIHDECIIDCHHSTPVLLDEDGTAWYPSGEQGGVNSVTIEVLKPFLIKAGIPLQPGRLTRNLVSRARSLIAVGTGIGVANISSIDGQPVGDGSLEFTKKCGEIFFETLENSWESMGGGN